MCLTPHSRCHCRACKGFCIAVLRTCPVHLAARGADVVQQAHVVGALAQLGPHLRQQLRLVLHLPASQLGTSTGSLR